jgi:hypothetical protein
MKINKLMIIHASRGRPVRGTVAAQRFIDNMTTKTPFTYYFSLDTDDETKDRYRPHVDRLGFVTETLVEDNKGCVDAVNKAAARLQDEDMLFVNGDDLGTPEGWDKLVLDFVETIPTDTFLVHFDFYPPNSSNCAIIQCISAGLYRKMGTLFHPEYLSMWADNDLFMTAKAMGAVYKYTGPKINFIHEHPAYGFNIEWDDTYRRTASAERFAFGHALYCRRGEQNFGISKS